MMEINESIVAERLYLADETGWGVDSKRKKVLGKKGASHVYVSKPSDESHKTLMLGVCGNGDVLKSLIILQESFPLIGENEVDDIPDDLLLSKTKKGSMEKILFTQWLEKSVLCHKRKVNPDHPSLLIIDNHSSRFSPETVKISEENELEIHWETIGCLHLPFSQKEIQNYLRFFPK